MITELEETKDLAFWPFKKAEVIHRSYKERIESDCPICGKRNHRDYYVSHGLYTGLMRFPAVGNSNTVKFDYGFKSEAEVCATHSEKEIGDWVRKQTGECDPRKP